MTPLSSEHPTTWQQHLEQADSQGLSLAAYAKTHSLNISMLYYWRSKLRKGFAGDSAPSAPVQFTAVRMVPPATTPYVIHLPAQVSLHCAMPPDPGWLADLCRQLERQP